MKMRIKNLRRGETIPVSPLERLSQQSVLLQSTNTLDRHRKSEGLRFLFSKVCQSGKMSKWIELRK